MRKASVVFWPTGSEMINQLLTRLAIKPVKVLIRKGPQQQFCLIEPTGVSRGVQGPQAWMSSEIGFGVVVNMRGALVHNQMNAPRTPIAVGHLPEAPQKVVVVV